LLEANIDTSASLPSKFTQIELSADFFQGLSPHEARKKIISYIYPLRDTDGSEKGGYLNGQ
jgi:hypothetical protein